MRELCREDVRPLPPQQWAAHYGMCQADGHTPLPLEAVPLYRALLGERVSNVEITVSRPGAAPRTVLTSGQPIQDAEGRKLGAVLSAIDVTGMKQLEEQLRMAQKMEAVGRLAGGVAHDFNNLLNVILGYSDLCLGEVEAGNPLHAKLEQIRKAAERAAALTRQLLAFSRKQVIKPTVLDLNNLLGELDKMLHRLLGEDIELVLEPAADLGRVKADPGQIEQIVMNLVLNARDAMAQGGRLTITTANVDLAREPARRRGQMQEGRWVLLSVSDTGTGMSPAVQARIFEPFFTTKPAGKGTGLGLATVYGVVKQNEGFVWVQSEPGHGSIFEVFLRRSEERLEIGKAAQESGATPRGMETILVVEDEQSIRNLVRESLEGCGYTVLEASNGPEAEAIARRHEGPIHLLMSDVILPRMSGRELAQRLYRLRPSLRSLFMSGYSEDAISEQGVLEPGAPFLEKPFPLTVMVRKVREVLQGPPAVREPQAELAGPTSR
jgi:signal transduction histidine kinase/CheY-like chemotaxis protein